MRGEKHQGLAALYTQDPRFTAYYDRAVPGCAAFLQAAVGTLGLRRGLASRGPDVVQ